MTFYIFIWRDSKPQSCFYECLACITNAGIVLQKFPVTTATAVDPSLRGQQTQILTSSIVDAAHRELTYADRRKVKHAHTHT